MIESDKFKEQCRSEVESQGKDKTLLFLTQKWVNSANSKKYSYNYEWLGRPIIQYPQDIVAMQELVWRIKPDLIIETGIAHGGSLIMSASMLALLDLCDRIDSSSTIDPNKSKRKVLGVDIDIRPHNRTANEAHPMACVFR